MIINDKDDYDDDASLLILVFIVVLYTPVIIQDVLCYDAVCVSVWLVFYSECVWSIQSA